MPVNCTSPAWLFIVPESFSPLTFIVADASIAPIGVLKTMAQSPSSPACALGAADKRQRADQSDEEKMPHGNVLSSRKPVQSASLTCTTSSTIRTWWRETPTWPSCTRMPVRMSYDQPCHGHVTTPSSISPSHNGPA